MLPSSQVVRAIPNYPQRIKGPYSSAYFEIEADYSKTDLNKIKEIQQKLGVDYLYVSWVPTGTEMDRGAIKTFNHIAQLFEFPGAREVGHGKYEIAAGFIVGCYAPEVTTDDIKKRLRGAAQIVAKQIAEKTGMLK